MFAVPDAPVSHGRWLAHCCAAVMVTFQLYALAAEVAANIDAATIAATIPPRSSARRPNDLGMYALPCLRGRSPLIGLGIITIEKGQGASPCWPPASPFISICMALVLRHRI